LSELEKVYKNLIEKIIVLGERVNKEKESKGKERSMVLVT
jgi:hypothetical protein